MHCHEQSLTVKNATSGVRFWTTVRPKQPEGTEYRALHLRSTEKNFQNKTQRRFGKNQDLRIVIVFWLDTLHWLAWWMFYFKDTLQDTLFYGLWPSVYGCSNRAFEHALSLME